MAAKQSSTTINFMVGFLQRLAGVKEGRISLDVGTPQPVLPTIAIESRLQTTPPAFSCSWNADTRFT